MSKVKPPVLPRLRVLGVLGIAFGAVGCGSANLSSADEPAESLETTAIQIHDLYRTNNPKVLLAAIAESTTDLGSRCWIDYRFTVQVHGSTLKIKETLRPKAATPGPACAAAAQPALQKVRLPVSWRDRRLVDVANGKRIQIIKDVPDSYSAVTPIG